MIISPPFLPQSGFNSCAVNNTDPDQLMTVVETYERGCHGVFPVTFDRRWHGGIHLVPPTLDEPVRAVADGEVVAYRISLNPISDGHIDEATGQEALNTNTGFLLLRHVTDTGNGRTLTFYSLYMHLLDLTAQQSLTGSPANSPQNSSPTALAAWLLEASDNVKQGNGKKVYRKDILGHWGTSQGTRHLHFETFMTEDDFTTWFDQSGHTVQLGEKNPVQPTSDDWWGHAYFVIPATAEFVARPGTPYDDPWFPALSRGKLPNDKAKLYVEAYFHKGQRYTRSWLDESDDGNCVLLTPEPVKDCFPEYEYKLYERALKLYPTCPSDGYELLRFGRILSLPPTLSLSQDKVTWVAVPFDANGTQGYVDISKTSIIKLSDADFPFFTGWQKINSGNAPLDANGLFSYRKLMQLVGDATAVEYEVSQDDPKFSLDDQLTYYVQGNDTVRNKLAGFVCHTNSEWDPANNDQRYQDLNNPDGYFGKRKDTDPDGYDRFVGFLKKLQFLDRIPALAGGKKLWYFHPLAFIRHFRKCGWLSRSELQQLLPKHVVQKGTPWKWQTVSIHGADPMLSASDHNAIQRRLALNNAIRKYGVQSPVRMASFFGNATEETQWFQKYHEGSPYWYKPWDGRGMLQLTHATNYIKYWTFRGLSVTSDVKTTLDQHTHLADSHRPMLNGHKGMYDPTNSLSDASTHIPSEIIERRNATANPFEAADSAGCYWVWSRAASCADEHESQQASTLRSLDTDHGTKYYYENSAFGKVAGTVNTGSPSSQYSSIWDIQSRFLAFANAQVILFDVTNFPQPNSSTSCLPIDFSRSEAP
ncbi:M23 family metallopeptidase [Paraburkholderia caledonica]|uniref:M23 family metallopeptidase n=1 Tax=Paraburkholderia caledonica TaxID=134536 RepID=UPI000480EAFF|nr:M23 family metallopeptidase [Paraburkholderia caledonica]